LKAVDVVPERTVLLLVVAADIVSPPCGLHKQHGAMIGNRNILQLRPPLVGVRGMLLQDCFYLVDSLGALLLKYLVSDRTREYMTGNVPSRSGEGSYRKRQNY